MKDRAWVSFLSRRWFDRRSRLAGSASSSLASAGIAMGVMALIVVVGVMNGFQSGYMQALLEVSSFHARLGLGSGTERGYDPGTALLALPGVRSVLAFREARVLAAAEGGRLLPLKVLILPPDFARRDPGFAAELGVDGSIFEGGRGLCLGSEAQRQLGLMEGERLSLFLPVSDPAEGLGVSELPILLSSTFTSGYYQFDSALALLPEGALGTSKAALDLAGSERVFGIKLDDPFADSAFLARAGALGLPPGARLQSWREYNRAFFGALRTEKTMMFLLVGLIFLVVGVNIHHAMRRMVAMRNEDIATLRALGAGKREIGEIFARNGLSTGLKGAGFGVAGGLLVGLNLNAILSAFSALGEVILELGRRVHPSLASLPPLDTIFYLNEIPIKLYPAEVLGIALVAALSALLAALSASRGIAGGNPSEILRHE